jgi:hypothetical protein
MVADIASWRHMARVCSNPSVERRRSSSAEAMGGDLGTQRLEQLPRGRVSPGPVQQPQLDQGTRTGRPWRGSLAFSASPRRTAARAE